MRPDAARALTDALTAPATPAELAREAEYVEAFLALHAPGGRLLAEVPAAGEVTPLPPRPGLHPAARRRRLRLATAAGLAAVAISGTAAALTTTLPSSEPGPPTRSAAPLPGATPTSPTSTAGSTAPGGGAPTGGGPRPTTSATGGPTVEVTGVAGSATGGASGSATGGGPATGTTGSATDTPPDSSRTTTAPPTPAHSWPTGYPAPSATRGPAPTSSAPVPSATGRGSAPTGELRSACRAWARGKLEPGSHRYEVLVDAAGGEDGIPAFCATLLGDGQPGD